MARFITPGKSPNKYARFYKTPQSSVLKVIRISLNSGADFGGVVDAPMREANPTINYGTADFQGNARFEAGYFGTGDRTNTVIKFGGLTGAGTGTVTNAKLRLFVVFGSNNTVNASVLNTAFDVNTVTWTIRQTATNWNVAGVYSGTDVSASVAAQLLVTPSNNGSYVELSGAGLDTYVQNVLNGTTDNGLLLYDNNQTTPSSTSSFVSSEGTNGTRPELVFTLTPNSGSGVTGKSFDWCDVASASISPNVAITSTSNDLIDISNVSISPTASATGSSFDLADTSTSTISPSAAIMSAISDLKDVSQANLTSSTAITSATIDLTDISNASLSPASNLSGISTDQADVSNALISPVQSSSISSAAIDLTDIAQASISSLVAITGTSNDLTDTSNASISPVSSVSGLSTDLRDVSVGTISPNVPVTSNATDLSDISSASINAIINVTSATVDQLDVSSASISLITSLNSASVDGQDISNALISPAPTFNNLSGLSADGADSSSALISPVNALSGTSIDGADSIGIIADVMPVLPFSTAGWKVEYKGKKKKKEPELEEIIIRERAPPERRGTITLAQMFGVKGAAAINIDENIKYLIKRKQQKDDEDLMMLY